MPERPKFSNLPGHLPSEPDCPVFSLRKNNENGLACFAQNCPQRIGRFTKIHDGETPESALEKTRKECLDIQAGKN